MARVLVTGVRGQLGSFVADLLHDAGHEVLGASTRPDAATAGPARLLSTPLTPTTAARVLEEAGQVQAVIHLAAQSSVGRSWADPVGTFESNATLAVAVAAAVAERPAVRLVNASSAEIFGCSDEPVQSERTPYRPASPYAVAKLAAHEYVVMLRRSLGLCATNAIIYPAESERRPDNFVVRKISISLSEIALGRREYVQLGDISVIRDFSHARDHARALMMLALQAPANDYVVASGVGHRIEDVVRVACAHLRLDPDRVVRSDSSLRRAADPPSLVGDATRLRALGWRPEVDFETLICSLVDYDLVRLRGR